jgi:ABC-type bacteriocin/lantibiotic exporter with double-glycine peptidase domain
MTRRLFIPEVVQTSMMDCGPASLKAMLEGHGVSVSYGRLREACQTDVDGTSIDTLEEVGAQLGLNTEQIMLPADHVLLATAKTLPALVVVRHPSGVTHFIIVWRKHGRFLQLMDPAIGRRWVSCRRFLDELYVHTLPVPAAGWREWAASAEFLGPLDERLAALKISGAARTRLLATAVADEGWRGLATLDAATRLLGAIMRTGGINSGRHAARMLEAFCHSAPDGEEESALTIPAAYWSVRPCDSDGDDEQLLLRGAVLVRVKGAVAKKSPSTKANAGNEANEGYAAPPLSPELAAALEERPVRPMRELLRMFSADGVLTPAALLVALLLAAGGVIVEIILFRGLLDLGSQLVLSRQRLVAFSFLVLFLLALVLLELPIASATLNLGRRLELRLRIAFLEKLPRLSDRYFHSRLTSDMAERAQTIHRIRSLPELGSQFVRSGSSLLLTAAALAWLSPSSALLVVLVAALAIAIPLLAHPVLSERDLRVRTHSGALSRFYMDALQGLVPIRTHSAEQAVRREHEGLLVEWTRASRVQRHLAVAVEGVQLFTGFGLAALLSYNYLQTESHLGGAVLLIYWALSLPALGQEIALLARQYPVYRNITLRLLEPMGAIEEETATESIDPETEFSPNVSLGSARGVCIALRDVSVRAAGHTILEDVNVAIESGSHVAIVGPSGAGKSSLVGLLLGWHRPAAGRVLVDWIPLEGERLKELRRHTAWVDPSVQLWNRSLVENLRYGAENDRLSSLGNVIEAADLGVVLEKLPDGMQTTLGEDGALVSGGEGQRVRLGRAMLRQDVRLVILDESFRGLDRERRRELLARTRRLWPNATLLCITHDIQATLSFERVLVVADGRIVEDGKPRELSRADSRYRSLLDAEETVRKTLWSGVDWRRLTLDKGQLSESHQQRREQLSALTDSFRYEKTGRSA